jgi:ornithine carbamoyltransferase
MKLIRYQTSWQAGGRMIKKDCVSIMDVANELTGIIEKAIELKKQCYSGEYHSPLKNKTLAMIFEKPSTRTRVSFEVGMTQLGGYALNLARTDIQLGRGETIADTGKVLSRYVDIIMYRAFEHEMVLALAKNATVPVINGLDKLEHPCQTLADLMTIKEKKNTYKGLKLVYVGDGNNVCNSLMLGAAILGMDMVVSCPDGFQPDKALYEKALEIAGGNNCKLEQLSDVNKAVEDADVIYTDTWVSMGDDDEAEQRLSKFQSYQVNEELVKSAKEDYLFMHCLPAHRGQEVTAGIMDGPNSVILDQAENRMHAQKALILFLLGAE